MTEQMDLMNIPEVELKDTATMQISQSEYVLVLNIITGEVTRYDTLGKATVATGEYGSLSWINGVLNTKDKPLSYLSLFINRYASDPRDFNEAFLYRKEPAYIVKNYATGKIYKLDSARQVENVFGKRPDQIFAYQHKNGVNSKLYKDCFLILDENKERIHWPKLEAKKRSNRNKTT